MPGWLSASLRLPWAVLSWALYAAVVLPLNLAGLILVPLAAAARAYRVRPSRIFPQRSVLSWSWPWMYLWGNEEDGVDGSRGGDSAQDWWLARTAGWSDWRRVTAWSAVRNSVGNLRWQQILHPRLTPSRVRSVAFGPVEMAWQGAYHHVLIEAGRFWLSIGWKIFAKDALLPAGSEGWRAYGSGFAMRIKWSRRV